MTAQLVHVRNIFMPQSAQQIACVEAGLTICDALERTELKLPPATVLVRNDVMVKRSEWDALPLDPDETVYLVTLPQGGGSSLRNILSMFVQIFATVVGTLIGGPLGGLVAFGLSFGGKLLINAILGSGKPKALPTQAPSYQLTAQRNQARLGGMIPEVFGQFMVTPDLVTQPWTYYAAHDQLALREVFCIGVGEYDIHQMRIGTNVFWEDGALTGTYSDIQVEIVPPGGVVTIFPDNVVQSTDVASIELLGTNQDGAGYVGPFVTNPVGTLTNMIGFDIVMPAGCFSVNDDGDMQSATVTFTVEYQKIDDNGDPIGGYVTGFSETIHIAFRDAVRRTYQFTMPNGRYRVRAKRTNARADDINTSDQIFWAGMRAFLPGNVPFGDVTLVAISAVATKNLNGDNAQQFNVICTRKLPLYDRVTKTWSAPTATRKIAAAASYMLRSENGGNLADNRIDLDTLWALEDTWTARGDTFDGIYTDKESLWDTLQEALRPGRTKRLLAGSQVTFVRDEPKSVPTAGFTPRNMLKGSFSIDYLLHDSNSVDGLVIQYYDSRTWAVAEVFCKLADSTQTMEEAPRMLIKGITGRDHAFREGMYEVANNRYRRKFPKFRTDLEGRTCFAGSLISVSHYLPKWGTSADAIALEGNDAGDIITLSEPYAQPTGTPLLKLLTPDGRVWGPVPVSLIDDGSDTKHARVQLLDTFDVANGKYAGLQPRDWPVWSGDGLQLERPRATIGHGVEVAQDALVVSMKPDSGMTATVTAVIDDIRVHEADGTDVPEETNPPSSALVEDLTVTHLILREATTLSGVQYVTVLNGAVSGAPDALSFELRLKWTADADYSDPIVNLGRTFSIPSAPGSVDAQIRAKGHSGWGAWFDIDGVEATGQPIFAPPALPPGDIDTGDGEAGGSGWVSGQPYTVSWAAVPNAYKYHIDAMAKVNAGDSYSNVRSTNTFNTTFTYTPTMETADGGPFYDLYLVITPVNSGGTGGGGTPTY